MEKKKIILYVCLSLVVISLMIGMFIWREYRQKSQGAGVITVVVLDEKSTELTKKEIVYHKGDTLAGLVEQNFSNVKIENGMIMTIETLITPADWSYFISIYRNDALSDVGIMDIKLVDGDVIQFVFTKYEA